MKRACLTIALMFAAALVHSQESTQEIPLKIVGVTDGDTVTALIDREQVRIRLEGIDAPERSQAFGTAAKDALSKLIASGRVSGRFIGEDDYGRKLGRLYVATADGRRVEVNAALVRSGFAWHYVRYSDDKSLAQAEKLAREEKSGLWSEANPLAPWEFRERQRTSPAEAATGSGSYWLNTGSNTRHNATCEYFKNTKRGRMCVADEGEACGKCGG